MKQKVAIRVFIALLLTASVVCCFGQKEDEPYDPRDFARPFYWSFYKPPAYDTEKAKESFVITLDDILENSGSTMKKAGRLPPTVSEGEWDKPIDMPYILSSECAFIDGKLHIPVSYGWDQTCIPEKDGKYWKSDVDECVRIVEIDYKTGSIGRVVEDTTRRSEKYHMYACGELSQRFFSETTRYEHFVGAPYEYRMDAETGHPYSYFVHATPYVFSMKKYDMKTKKSRQVASYTLDKSVIKVDEDSDFFFGYTMLINSEDYILYKLTYQERNGCVVSKPPCCVMYVFFRTASEEVFFYREDVLKVKLFGTSKDAAEEAFSRIEQGFFYGDTFYLASGQTFDPVTGKSGAWGAQYLGEEENWVRTAFQSGDLLFLETHDEEETCIRILDMEDGHEITKLPSLAPSAAEGNDMYDITNVICAVVQNKVYYSCTARGKNAEDGNETNITADTLRPAFAFCEYDMQTGVSRRIVDFAFDVNKPCLLICGDLYCVIFDNTLYCGKLG